MRSSLIAGILLIYTLPVTSQNIWDVVCAEIPLAFQFRRPRLLTM